MLHSYSLIFCKHLRISVIGGKEYASRPAQVIDRASLATASESCALDTNLCSLLLCLDAKRSSDGNGNRINRFWKISSDRLHSVWSPLGLLDRSSAKMLATPGM
jgi:hypothetical protein